MPLVYIGQFFFLNLTLAVVNNSFNDTQEKYAAAKIKAEQESLQFKANKNEDEENLEQDEE